MAEELNVFGYLISQVMRNLQKDLEQRFRDNQVLITYEQWTIISCFREEIEAGYSQQEIADKTERDQPCTSRIINNLVKHDLLIRVSDEKDRRVNKIYLTKKGRELVETTDCIASQAIAEATKGIEIAELDICKRVLQEISKNVGKEK